MSAQHLRAEPEVLQAALNTALLLGVSGSAIVSMSYEFTPLPCHPPSMGATSVLGLPHVIFLLCGVVVGARRLVV